jgi:energy-coupling factor transporter transmembrane protein EcfT
MALLQRLDPRTKFLLLIILGVQLFLVGTWPSVAAAGVLTAAGLHAGGVPGSLILRRLTGTLWFGVVIILVGGMTAGGTVLVGVGPGYVTAEGIQDGAFAYLRILIAVLASTAFMCSTPLPALVEGIESAARVLPRRLSPAVTALTVTLNLAPIMVRTARRLRMSLQARGIPASGGLVARLRAMTRSVTPFIILAMRTADDLSLAMDARCYVPGARRTTLRSRSLRASELLLPAILTLVTLALLIFT